MTTRFEIESRSDLDFDEEHTGRYTDWRSDGIGEPNSFATRAEAEDAIIQLRGIGREWAEAEYRIVEASTEDPMAFGLSRYRRR